MVEMKRRSRKTKRFDFDFLIVHVENCAKYIINYLQGNFKLRLIFSPFVFSCMSGTYIFVLYKYTHIYISMCAPQLVSLFQILNFLFLSNLIFVCNFLFPVMHPISNSFMPAIGVTGCTVHVVLRIQSGKHRDTDTHTQNVMVFQFTVMKSMLQTTEHYKSQWQINALARSLALHPLAFITCQCV